MSQLVCAYFHWPERRQLKEMRLGSTLFMLSGGRESEGGDLLTAAMRAERGQYDARFVVPLSWSKCLTTRRDKAGDRDAIEIGIRFASAAHWRSRYPLRRNFACPVKWPCKLPRKCIACFQIRKISRIILELTGTASDLILCWMETLSFQKIEANLPKKHGYPDS